MDSGREGLAKNFLKEGAHSDLFSLLHRTLARNELPRLPELSVIPKSKDVLDGSSYGVALSLARV